MPASPAALSAAAGVSYLKDVMDEYHRSVPVYQDVSSAGNRFHAWTIIPEGAASDGSVSMNGSSTNSRHSGTTAIRCQFVNTTGSNFGGFYLQNGVLPAGASCVPLAAATGLRRTRESSGPYK